MQLLGYFALSMAGFAALICAGIWFAGWREDQVQNVVQNWLTTDATIESGSFETIPGGGGRTGKPMKAPVLSFSYQAGGSYFSGRVALTQFFDDEGAGIIKLLLRQKIEIRYDPQDASRWFLDDDTFHGCRFWQEGMKPEDSRTF